MSLLLVSAASGAGPVDVLDWAEAPRTMDDQPLVRYRHDPSTEEIAMALRGLADGDFLSVAILRQPPPPNLGWVAFEWHGALVTDGHLEEIPAVEVDQWRLEGHHGEYLVWRRSIAQTDSALRVVYAPDEFGDAIHSSDPVAMNVDLGEVDLADEQLFRNYAACREGGSCALVTLSGARWGDSDVLLRNPAALLLDDISANASSAAHFLREGAIEVRAVGLSSDDSADGVFQGFADPDTALATWRGARWRPGDFWIVAELSAPVDPTVIIPSGSIFEQTSLNGVQTLAPSAPATMVVQPGGPTTVAVPAWCLNRWLSAPGGQPLRITPLRARHNAHTSQDEVWTERARIIGSIYP
jgi:hypothetical protein